MRKIGIGVYTAPEAGGAYQYTRSLLDAAHRIEDIDKNYRFIVYSPFPMWKDICDKIGIRFCLLKTGGLRKLVYHLGSTMMKLSIDNSIFFGAHPMWESYKKDRLDMMLISSPTWYGKPSYAKCIIPIFDIMHHYLDFEEVAGPKVSKERDQRYGAICKHADGILVDSKLGKEQVSNVYGGMAYGLKDKVYDLPFIVSDYIKEGEKGTPVKLPEKFIFYPAQFWKHKNHVRLVEACGRLKAEGINVTLLFTGTKKNASDDIDEAIKRNDVVDQIVNLGYVENEELVYIYQKARAMIFPAFTGPTSIPPLEAMVYGCPLGVADNFAMPQQVGEAGLTFAPDSVDEITECMRKLWCDDELCAKLSAEGIKRSKLWTVNEFSNRLKEIIESVI